MRAGLVGPSYEAYSLPFDAQRTVNMYPVINETGSGKDVAALYGVPGKRVLATVGGGPIRGTFASAKGRVFAVSDTELFEIQSDGSSTVRGSLITSGTDCTFDETPLELAVCDGTNLYILEYSSNTFVRVTDADFPGASTVAQLDGYFIVNKPDTGEFYLSDLLDGKSWTALNFATAESSPDNLVRPFSVFGQLLLFGEQTAEIWYNSGATDFPFARVEGGMMEKGCAAAGSVAKIDNTVFWLGKDKDGQGMVYRATGFTPVRISTHPMEEKIRASGDLSGIKAFTYQADGHTFYALTGGNLGTTLVYDAAIQQWHERAYLEPDGTYSNDLAGSCVFAFNKHLVGDRTSGTIYELSRDVYDDAGNQLSRSRTFSHIFNEGQRFKINSLRVDFEYGVGLEDGSDATAWLEISEDGGRTWSKAYNTSIGRIGTRGRAIWRRLGYMEQATFRVTITDPVKVAICGAYFA